jgi:hypothetical protein
METKLTIRQRINVINLLSPVASSAAKRKIINDAIGELSLSVEEIKQAQYHEETVVGPQGQPSLSYRYQPAGDPMKLLKFDEVVVEILRKIFLELDKQEKLNGELFPLYELFVDLKTVPFSKP